MDSMDMATQAAVYQCFKRCTRAIMEGELIRRVSDKDKEFHFQNWCRDRLAALGSPFESGGRNSYPDFRIVSPPVGYEIKGLGYPGRVVNYDCNSQLPTGNHNGREIFYVFGRYPAKPDTNEYAVLDLVICHGDFLNADHEYIHKNRSFRGFGSYGDILLRDRKMYVAPTPFGLLEGVERQVTLVVPRAYRADEELVKVGDVDRVESDKIVVAYSFDLSKNQLTPTVADNPRAGTVHHFVAMRLNLGIQGPNVNLRQQDGHNSPVVMDDE